MYRDYSREAEDKLLELVLKDDQHFPLKLHEMICETEKNAFEHIICWLPHGRAFMVHSKNDLVKRVLPLWFRMSKYNSFERQLTSYGFRKIKNGIDKGALYHELFLRGMRFLCCRIQKIPPTGRRNSKKEPEPDLYSFPLVGISSTRINKADSQIKDRDSVTNSTTSTQVPGQTQTIEHVSMTRRIQLGDASSKADLDTKMPPKRKISLLGKTVQSSEGELISTFLNTDPSTNKKEEILMSADMPGREELLLKTPLVETPLADKLAVKKNCKQIEGNKKYFHGPGIHSIFSDDPTGRMKSSGATKDFQIPNPMVHSGHQVFQDLQAETSNVTMRATSKSKISRCLDVDTGEMRQLVPLGTSQLNQEVASSKRIKLKNFKERTSTNHFTHLGASSEFLMNEVHLFMNNFNIPGTDQSKLPMPLNGNTVLHDTSSLKSKHQDQNLLYSDFSSEFSKNEAHLFMDNLNVPGIDQSQLLMPLNENNIFDDLVKLESKHPQKNKNDSKSQDE